MLAEKTLFPRMGSYQTFYVIRTYVKKMFEKKARDTNGEKRKLKLSLLTYLLLNL